MEKLEKISCGIVLKRVGDVKLETFLIYQSIYENVLQDVTQYIKENVSGVAVLLSTVLINLPINN